MSGKQLCVAMLSVATILAVSAAGEEEKNEVGGQLGRTFIRDQGIPGATFFDPIIHSGEGLTVGGEDARRFWVAPVYSISAEGLLVYNWDVDLNAGGTGNPAVPGKSTTSAVVEAGLGLDAKVWRRLSLRGGVRDFWAGQPDFPLAPTGKSRRHNLLVSSGVFWRF